MADKVKKDNAVRDIVRSLVAGVITPRHATDKLRVQVMAAYIRGFAAGQDTPKEPQ